MQSSAIVADSKGKLAGILGKFDCLRLLTHGDAQAEAPREDA